MRVIKIMMLGILVVIVLFSVATVSIGFFLSTPGYKGPKNEHFDGRTFRNSSGIKEQGFINLIKWMLNRNRGTWSDFSDQSPSGTIKQDAQRRITFINHATFLIQTGRFNILTDPIWSNRCSPFTWTGPRRMRPPGIAFEELPAIHIVIISHNHYDHLDLATVRRLSEVFDPKFIVPLGVKKFLTNNGIENITELDWNGTMKWDGIQITAVEAQHFSGRDLFDRNKTLWCGYLIEEGDRRIYFAGDTGYGDLFKKIGKDYGPMDVSLIPIGAFVPRWFMSPIHASPDEALKIHFDIRSKRSIGMHFGTFPLADDGMEQPVNELEKAKKERSIDTNTFTVLENGQFIHY